MTDKFARRMRKLAKACERVRLARQNVHDWETIFRLADGLGDDGWEILVRAGQSLDAAKGELAEAEKALARLYE